MKNTHKVIQNAKIINNYYQGASDSGWGTCEKCGCRMALKHPDKIKRWNETHKDTPRIIFFHLICQNCKSESLKEIDLTVIRSTQLLCDFAMLWFWIAIGFLILSAVYGLKLIV